MNIYVLRHGETDWTKEERLQGHTDIPLNQRGREQVEDAADILLRSGIRLDLIITSPLRRARESAEIVADRLLYDRKAIVVEPLLIERFFGVGEGLTLAERKAKYPDNHYPGMESFEDFLARARIAFDGILHTYIGKQNILLAAHGAILYAMMTAIAGKRVKYGGKAVIFPPGSLHLVRVKEDGTELAEYDGTTGEFVNFEWG